jgi:hypothetical protein
VNDTQRLALARALGVAPKEPPTPAQLNEQLSASRAEAAAERERARATAVELAVLRAAARHQADGDALLDSASFMQRIGHLDPGAGNFSEQVTEAIEAAARINPACKVAPRRQPPAVRASGAADTAQPPSDRQWTDADVARSTRAELGRAMKAGLLRDLGVGASRSRGYR